MKSLIAVITILCVIGMSTGITVWGATTGTISATVTAVNISVYRGTDGTITYGSVALSSSTSTDPSGINDGETFGNNGNTNEKFSIKTSDASGGTAWTVGASAGSDIFVHSFATTSSPTWQILNTTDTYETASSTVQQTATTTVYMQIDMPTAASDYSQKTITITVLAEQA